MTFEMRRDPDHLEKLPALAHRLGVRQIVSDGHVGLTLSTREGQRYDVLELVNAILDRVDAALAKVEP